MFLKSSNLFSDNKKNSSLSILGDGIDFSGEINTEGNIHIDGIMRGVIKANEVVIGPKGDFDGEIIAEILIINGTIKGKFNIRNLHIKKDGLLQGRAKYEVLIVDSGGKIQGELGINKQNKLLSKKNGKDKTQPKNGSTSNN
jgi:cytoskeletal protein CcmA (bactofilin family)